MPGHFSIYVLTKKCPDTVRRLNVKSVRKNVGCNKTCSTAQSGSHMFQHLSLNEFNSDTQEELLNKLINATETNQFQINSLAYEIHNVKISLPEEVT